MEIALLRRGLAVLGGPPSRHAGAALQSVVSLSALAHSCVYAVCIDYLAPQRKLDLYDPQRPGMQAL